jgi:hypothetical protein
MPLLVRVAAPAVLLLAVAPASAQEHVASTLHNLSVSGPGKVRALDETEVCKFCHIPHNALVDEPLWGHALSEVEAYRVPTLGSRRAPAPQPDGSSRLCLSCHDGTVALGDIAQSGETIEMSGAQRLGPERPGHLGTDLSGSHPVSFVPKEVIGEAGSDILTRSLDQIESEGIVRLDAERKMQCTTCHDPHSDRYYDPGRVPRFWVRPTVDEVCRACHELH